MEELSNRALGGGNATFPEDGGRTTRENRICEARQTLDCSCIWGEISHFNPVTWFKEDKKGLKHDKIVTYHVKPIYSPFYKEDMFISMSCLREINFKDR